MTSVPLRFSNIGVDTGGTFTDLVLIDDKGTIQSEKSFSTPDAPERGIFDVLERAANTLEPCCRCLSRHRRLRTEPPCRQML